MLTLGIHDGHTATACLLEDGKILSCISEERISRKKEHSGFPKEAILECMRLSNRSIEEVDAVGVCSLMPQIGSKGWHEPPFYKRLFGHLTKVVPSTVLQSPKNIKRIHRLSNLLFYKRKRKLLGNLLELGVEENKVSFFEHHLCHAATTYYTSWYSEQKTLVLTLDGSGDAVCATISIGENGKLNRIAEIFNYNSICDFYTYVTTFLGMKPMSHEYKVMGLAPYASDYGRDEIIEKFQNYFRIDPKDPLQIQNTSGGWKWRFYKLLQKDLGNARFDIVAGALQEVFEDVIVAWIKGAIRKTNVRSLALSGGGFMNVKLNDRILNLPEVDQLFIFPSCGDESNPIGASILAAIKHDFPSQKIEKLDMIDWGAAYNNEDIEKAISKLLKGTAYTIKKHGDINQVVAEKVADGSVIGRLQGRMEWGARALGNRSIIADAKNPAIIHKINKAIKMRDFWMPFAPAILQEYRKKYVKLREDYYSPFMTVAPETYNVAWEDIPAGLHPFDHTARCQIVDPRNHPSFHDLITKFEKITGRGGLLNTSFNLHGEAIVMTPEDAIHTFINSDLDVLQMEDYLVEK